MRSRLVHLIHYLGVHHLPVLFATEETTFLFIHAIFYPHHTLTNLKHPFLFAQLLQLIPVFQFCRLIDVANFGVEFAEKSEEAEDIQEYEVLDLSIEIRIVSIGILIVGGHVV